MPPAKDLAMRISTVSATRFVTLLAIASLGSRFVFAEGDAPTETKPLEQRFKISGWIDSGMTFNSASPQDNQNFGRFFDDRANEPLLNQFVINFERALAPQ